jgi:2-keto-3-deoxy-6-phosphogluconate aldolase
VVGMGSKLITADAIKDKGYDHIANRISECIGWIRKAREK